MSDLDVNLLNPMKSKAPGAHRTIRVSRLCCGEFRTLDISFRRTFRVPDNKKSYELPPDLGAFPIYNVDDFTCKLPESIAVKGGVFIPIYHREAMWIRFTCSHPFAIKIMVGDVNAISGKERQEEPQMITRQESRIAKSKSVQDYAVPPYQSWLDGVATGDGFVRQFVANPVGGGYSVEAQVTGGGQLAGIQFEITPRHIDSHDAGNLAHPELPLSAITIEMPTGELFPLRVAPCYTIGHIKKMIEDREGIPTYMQRLTYPRIAPEDGDDASLSECGISEGATFLVNIIHGLRSGGGGEAFKGYPLKEMRRMKIEAGGTFSQSIYAGEGNAKSWDKQKTILFNLQLFNAPLFKQMLGIDPPDTPVTAATYAKHGYPFFKVYEQPTGVYGDAELKSTDTFDKEIGISSSTREEEGHLAFSALGRARDGSCAVRLNTVDEKSQFVPLEELAFHLAKSAVPPTSK